MISNILCGLLVLLFGVFTIWFSLLAILNIHSLYFGCAITTFIPMLIFFKTIDFSFLNELTGQLEGVKE